MAKNSITFLVSGRFALFSDPLTRLGGEKSSYHVPTYEALKGIVKSIYWKPTLTWYVKRVRIMKSFRTHTKGMKPISYEKAGNTLAIYTYLVDVAYQVEAYFEWNLHRPELAHDRIERKHDEVARRRLEKGGRQDIFLGTRDCQGYVTPCRFGEGEGAYDHLDELGFGLMFHGFDYPDETGENWLKARFWRPVMKNGIINFIRPEECPLVKPIHPMKPKSFVQDVNFSGLQEEGLL